MNYTLNVVNNTSASTITVTGERGDNFQNVASNQTISPRQSLIVAMFNAGDPGQDRWGWIYLDIDGIASQIYIESTAAGQPYAYFGYYNSKSSESNSNPSPFPGGIATVQPPQPPILLTATYTLLNQPPQQPG